MAPVDISFDWGDDGMFDGPIEQMISKVRTFATQARYAGYTYVHFRQEFSYEESWYEPHGVRQETHKEMNIRFKKIRLRRKRVKAKKEKKHARNEQRRAAERLEKAGSHESR